MVSANRPLIKPADFEGLKFRISGSKIADRYFRDLGSIPQIMAFSEVYSALQTGVVDGCENTPSNYLTQKFYEVQKDITVSYHAHLQYAVIVNSKFWNGLPPDIRGQLEKAMDDATDYTNSIARKENEDALAEIKKSGKTTLHYLTDDERKQWQNAMQPTYKWAKGRVGRKCSISSPRTRRQDELTTVFPRNNKNRTVGSVALPAVSSMRYWGTDLLRALNSVLDHLEEWLIATLIAAATGLIFVAVVHRYGTGLSIDFSQMGDRARVHALASPR